MGLKSVGKRVCQSQTISRPQWCFVVFQAHWKLSLSLQLDESATYSTVRETILRWDRSQQKRHNLLQCDSSEAVPMEIDRPEGRGHYGKSKGKGKNKGKNDSNQKGKS